MRDNCPVCLSTARQQLFGAREVPVMMHRLYATAQQARNAPLATLDLIRCGRCGFVWNQAFDPKKLQYDTSYENNQAHSVSFSEHMLARADAVLRALPSEESISYLEVGCGQGAFLTCVIERAGGRLQSAEGFDPAYRRNEKDAVANRIHEAYFNSESAKLLLQAPNVVVTRHTIEHVPEPVEFLRTIRDALGDQSSAIVCVETPDVSWIIKNTAIQDFFYEHCSLFTADSLAIALRRAGFQSPGVEYVFGGQYLWATGRAGAVQEQIDATQTAVLPLVSDMRSEFVDRWRKRVEFARCRGPVALWGAGAKGVTFALLVDPDGRLIDHVIDINPEKQGHYLPGSGLPIISAEASAIRELGTIFVMNPIYLDEIGRAATAAGISADLIPIN